MAARWPHKSLAPPRKLATTAATALPRYVGNTALLLVAVACGVVSIGVVAAWLVTAYRFPGHALLQWALLLPLAMPAYVMAYAYTDWLQFTGPVQSALRAATGWQARDQVDVGIEREGKHDRGAGQ